MLPVGAPGSWRDDGKDVVLLDAEDDADHFRDEIRKATEQGRVVIVVAKPTSRLAPVLDGIRAGHILGVVARPLRHADIMSVLHRKHDVVAAYRDVLKLLRSPVRTTDH